MTSPVTPGTASLLVELGIHPMTPKKPPQSPAIIAERAERTALRKRELETAAEADAANQALEACETTVANPSAATALKAAAKKARLERKQSTQAAIAKAQAQTAAMPPPPAPGAQARAGKDNKKNTGPRIKKKTPKAALPSDNTDADERAPCGVRSGFGGTHPGREQKGGKHPPHHSTLLTCSVCSRLRPENQPHLQSQKKKSDNFD